MSQYGPHLEISPVLTPSQGLAPEDVQQDSDMDIAQKPEQPASTSLQENSKRSEPEIQAMLGEELEALLKKKGINPLIGMPGTYEISTDSVPCSQFLQGLIYISTHQQKYFTQYFSVS